MSKLRAGSAAQCLLGLHLFLTRALAYELAPSGCLSCCTSPAAHCLAVPRPSLCTVSCPALGKYLRVNSGCASGVQDAAVPLSTVRVVFALLLPARSPRGVALDCDDGCCYKARALCFHSCCVGSLAASRRLCVSLVVFWIWTPKQ